MSKLDVAAFQKQVPNEVELEYQKLFEELVRKYTEAICTSAALEEMNIVPRKRLIGEFCREGDLGFVFGERGSGKTWLVDALAAHLSTGKDLDSWTVPEACNVLLVDGEMPADAARDRLSGMTKKNCLLHLLHHELLFDKFGLTMNMADARTQRVITEICVRKNVKVLILDNLSCLFAGVKENEADEWEKVLGWLLDLRRRKIAVLIVHHAGAEGKRMRGTTKREDAAFWIIKVEEIKDGEENKDGARFETTFVKQRNSAKREWTRQWHFKTGDDGSVSISCEEISFDEKVLRLIQDGLTSASDIAQELNSSKPTVCRAAKRLGDNKLIEISARAYKPRGFMETKS